MKSIKLAATFVAIFSLCESFSCGTAGTCHRPTAPSQKRSNYRLRRPVPCDLSASDRRRSRQTDHRRCAIPHRGRRYCGIRRRIDHCQERWANGVDRVWQAGDKPIEVKVPIHVSHSDRHAGGNSTRTCSQYSRGLVQQRRLSRCTSGQRRFQTIAARLRFIERSLQHHASRSRATYRCGQSGA